MEIKTEAKTLGEIRIAGIEALVQHLGVVGTIRFLQYEEKGYGDYARDRHRWLGEPDLNQIADEIKKMRK
ncbi:MAG TPA: hypothetical protein ENH53_09965 [Bacteroidetes bacterium]|nr:hypothetical protein [Bacteroidota bacterium]